VAADLMSAVYASGTRGCKICGAPLALHTDAELAACYMAVLVPPMRDALARAIGAFPAERAKALDAIAKEDT